MTAVPDLYGDHLRLRELHPADYPVYERIVTHRVLTRYLGTDRMDTRQAAAAFSHCLAQRHTEPRRKYTLAVCTPDDDTMLGTCGLLVEDYGSNALLTGLAVLPGSPVRGHTHEAPRLLAAYAFGPLGLHRVWAGHRTDHRAMHRIMDAVGLHREATVRSLFCTQGIWHDVITYAALGPDWKRGATPAEAAVLAGQATSSIRPATAAGS
ncbi:hypothetical protein SRB5_56700 [Streptomyces sp. RB5]|uniref:N-acetyltransferase domain-containing protein n=1 Tax=Streptomyces smaragdinus TaxID=2585196 RepID=A0A7K0CPT3_9ACTN|nr:GNAT family protein [Streptomyces smaragdinus]MQY15488.1 hypothetical protein [Streptomyces smaragdinus]